jgi:hypothetical protein
MRILNLTHSPCWFDDHFQYLLAQTGHTGETSYRSEGNFNADKANRMWKEYESYFNSFDAILVSHLSTWCRPFLQNNWKKPLFIWFFFRFDHDIDDTSAYYDLLRDARNHRQNVKIFAATEYDRQYAQNRLGEFPIEIVHPLICINNENKTKIPCGEDTFFLLGKHNESLFVNRLNELGIPTYRHNWEASVPDLRGVRGIIHIPYVYATRSLIENLALENVYFLPSQSFLRTLRRADNFFWDGGMIGESLGDFSLAEWYNEEHKNLFVYFNSFEDLKQISDSPHLKSLIEEKKRNIREFNQRYNEEALRKWKDILQ